MIENFPGNSRKVVSEGNDEQTIDGAKKFEKIENIGPVVRRKKPLGRRFMDTFFSGNSNSVFGYLLKEVLVPALQNMATDMVTQGIEKAVYGEVRSAGRTGRSTPGSRTHISYDRYASTRPASMSVPVRKVPTRPSAFDVNEIILGSHIEASTVMDKLVHIIQEYNGVTVADLNDLIGQTSEYTDHKWGWTDLSEARIRRIREGYLLDLPEPEDMR